ncbi:MAG: hypothetical protein KUG64_11055 [Cycloclasticus sp.]|nr:hypothetical protein [Cycloclasticus sp.]
MLDSAVSAIHTLLSRNREDIKWTDVTATDKTITLVGYLMQEFDDYIAIFQGRRLMIEIPLELFDCYDSESRISAHLNDLYGAQIDTYNQAKARALVTTEAARYVDVTPSELLELFGEELDDITEQDNDDDLPEPEPEQKPTLH